MTALEFLCKAPSGRRWGIKRRGPDEGFTGLKIPHPSLRDTLSRWERDLHA